MYIQITTKCNMHCAHCCYACTAWGRHGDYDTIDQALRFAEGHTDTISIGGGEPTLHPRFWDILQNALNRFDYVWMATNGSQTDTMYRLASIMQDYDDPEYYCTCEYDPDEWESEEEWDEHRFERCYCEPITLRSREQLAVALSQDYFHDPIEQRVVDTWKRNRWEIRNVTRSASGVAAQGRAKKTGSGWGEYCVCGDIFIAPTGKVKLCGCNHSPVIGDVWHGIEDKWLDVIVNSEAYQNSRCYKGLRVKA